MAGCECVDACCSATPVVTAPSACFDTQQPPPPAGDALVAGLHTRGQTSRLPNGRLPDSRWQGLLDQCRQVC